MINYAKCNIGAKSNCKYTCCECGSTELIQAHHNIPKDDNSIVVLCAICHHERHPNLPLSLFTNKTKQPYWNNISASSLARILNKHPRTICRTAKSLGIGRGVLSNKDRKRIVNKLTLPSIPTCVCKKCHYKWVNRLGTRPKECPECKNRRWDKECKIF